MKTAQPSSPARRLAFLAAGLLALALTACAGVLPSVSSTGTPTAVTRSATRTPVPTLPPTATRTIVPTITLTPTVTPLPSATSTPEEGALTAIGYTNAGRPLEVIRFGNGPVQRMIVAGIHGGYESNTVALADQLIAYLRDNPTVVPEEKTLFILRVLNPDGLARSTGPDGRANENGVDLNRNWDALWQADWERADCWDRAPITAGPRPGSEPEVQALAKFLIEHPFIDALISYHSAGLGIFPGGQPPDVASDKLGLALSRVTPYTFPPAPSLCKYTGQLIDWASLHGIAAVDVELNNHSETDLAINVKVLKVFLNWTK